MSETDPNTELGNPAVRTISGQVDLSREAFDRSTPELDTVIASELGRVYAEFLDAHLLNHATDGTLNVTGITSVAYTDTNPIVAEAWPKLMQLISETSTAWKNTVPTLIAHQRRLAWLYSDIANPPNLPHPASGS